MEKQQQVSRHRQAQKIGRRLEVIIDGKNEEGYLARSSADAPEIDGVVYVETNRVLTAGDQVAVEITDSDAYDLHGRTLEAGGDKKRADESAQASKGNKPGGRPASRTSY